MQELSSWLRSDKRLKITEQFVKCFRDNRHPSYVDYSIHQLLAQRVYRIILGDEDINDHDNLRYDSALYQIQKRLLHSCFVIYFYS